MRRPTTLGMLTRRIIVPSLHKATAQRALASIAAGLDLGLPAKYGHFIGGSFVEPKGGEYFDNASPIDGQTFIKAARGTKPDIDAAVEAATMAYKSTWSKTSVTERSNILLKIADIVEANADRLAKIETVDNGKAVRESMAADLPLVIDHFRYFAGVIRAEEGSASEVRGRDGPGQGLNPARSAPRPEPRARSAPRRSQGYTCAPPRPSPRFGDCLPHHSDRLQHGLALHPRAARRRRPDHPMELPTPHGGMEGIGSVATPTSLGAALPNPRLPPVPHPRGLAASPPPPNMRLSARPRLSTPPQPCLPRSPRPSRPATASCSSQPNRRPPRSWR